MANSKGMGIKTSVKSGNFRKTKQGAGMTKKGVAAYRKANPGSKLKTAVKSLANIDKMLSEAKGGWRTLMWAAGAGGAVAAFVLTVQQFFWGK